MSEPVETEVAGAVGVVADDAATDVAKAAEWFCDQCGVRYQGPGVCTNMHPPAQLKKVADVAAVEDGSATEEQAAAVEQPSSELEPEAAAAVQVETPDPVVPVPVTATDQGVETLDEAKSLLALLSDLIHQL